MDRATIRLATATAYGTGSADRKRQAPKKPGLYPGLERILPADRKKRVSTTQLEPGQSKGLLLRVSGTAWGSVKVWSYLVASARATYELASPRMSCVVARGCNRLQIGFLNERESASLAIGEAYAAVYRMNASLARRISLSMRLATIQQEGHQDESAHSFGLMAALSWALRNPGTQAQATRA